MNKQQLIESVATGSGLSKEAVSRVMTYLIDSIEAEVAGGGDVRIIGFGTFQSRNSPEREGRNPKTGLPLLIKSKRLPVFKPGSEFKQRVNNG